LPLLFLFSSALAADTLNPCATKVEQELAALTAPETESSDEILNEIATLKKERLRPGQVSYAENDAALLVARNRYIHSRGFSWTVSDGTLAAYIVESLEGARVKPGPTATFLEDLKKIPADWQQRVIDEMVSDRVIGGFEQREEIPPFVGEGPRDYIQGVVTPPLWRIVADVQKKMVELNTDPLTAILQVKSIHKLDIDRVLRSALRERLDEVATSRDLKITAKGVIESDESGMPDAHSLKVAEDAYGISRRNPDYRYMTATEKETVQHLAAVYQKTLEGFFTGDNAKLRELTYTEVNAMPRSGTIDSFIQDHKYTAGSIWWVDGDPKFAQITEKTSRGLPRQLYAGQKFKRSVFWPTDKGERGVPDVGTFRVATNKLENGKESLEVFFKDSNGIWQPFFYEKSGGTWVPLQKIRMPAGNYVPVREACSSCHMGAGGNFSPRPRMLKTEQDFRNVGYTDGGLIHQLQRFP
jgi:hypothetical protein